MIISIIKYITKVLNKILKLLILNISHTIGEFTKKCNFTLLMLTFKKQSINNRVDITVKK